LVELIGTLLCVPVAIKPKAIEKILTLPLEFYDENNPGRIAGRVARGLKTTLGTLPRNRRQLIPKLFGCWAFL